MQNAWVYLVANRPNGTLNSGVTGNLRGRAMERQTERIRLSFGSAPRRLVWYERHDDFKSAIARESELRNWPRAWKVALVAEMNPEWNDLYDTLV
jgi:putative endonuclease